MASMTTTQTDKSDPVVLGVSVPVGVTVTAAKQVGEAWRTFGTELVHALTQARETAKSSPKSKKKKGTSDEREAAAAAAAGASA